MHQFNEEIAWQRLQDRQREVENSRLAAENAWVATGHLLRRLSRQIGALAARSSRQPAELETSEQTRHVA